MYHLIIISNKYMTQFNTAKHTHKINKIVLTQCKQVLHGTNIFEIYHEVTPQKKKKNTPLKDGLRLDPYYF
jgi:hypothetical protein